MQSSERDTTALSDRAIDAIGSLASRTDERAWQASQAVRQPGEGAFEFQLRKLSEANEPRDRLAELQKKLNMPEKNL